MSRANKADVQAAFKAWVESPEGELWRAINPGVGKYWHIVRHGFQAGFQAGNVWTPQTVDAAACFLHNAGSRLVGNTGATDLPWITNQLFTWSRLGAGDIKTVDWLLSREQWDYLGLEPEAVFGRRGPPLGHAEPDPARCLAQAGPHLPARLSPARRAYRRPLDGPGRGTARRLEHSGGENQVIHYKPLRDSPALEQSKLILSRACLMYPTELLRLAGFKIYSRPREGPPLRSYQGLIVPETFALVMV
jgi:hypothetical protein